MYFFIKILISAVIIATVSELAKHYRLLSAVIVSLPLTSLLAIVWIYIDLGDRNKIIDLSQDIFWLVLASLVFFVALPLLLKSGSNFWAALALSCLATSCVYGLYVAIRTYF